MDTTAGRLKATMNKLDKTFEITKDGKQSCCIVLLIVAIILLIIIYFTV